MPEANVHERERLEIVMAVSVTLELIKLNDGMGVGDAVGDAVGVGVGDGEVSFVKRLLVRSLQPLKVEARRKNKKHFLKLKSEFNDSTYFTVLHSLQKKIRILSLLSFWKLKKYRMGNLQQAELGPIFFLRLRKSFLNAPISSKLYCCNKSKT